MSVSKETVAPSSIVKVTPSSSARLLFATTEQPFAMVASLFPSSGQAQPATAAFAGSAGAGSVFAGSVFASGVAGAALVVGAGAADVFAGAAGSALLSCECLKR